MAAAFAPPYTCAQASYSSTASFSWSNIVGPASYYFSTANSSSPRWRHNAADLSVTERARIALTHVRRPSLRLTVAKPRASLTGAHTLSPRRTVVPRGTVSWVRAGTRRPL